MYYVIWVHGAERHVSLPKSTLAECMAFIAKAKAVDAKHGQDFVYIIVEQCTE